MDDGTPTLEVGFAIDTGNSFSSLVQLQEVMNSTEAKVVAEAAKIERATGGMINMGAATASIHSFGAAATKEAQSSARELSRVEKAGEALSRQLDKQASTFGRTREEIRGAKVETAALAAEQQGLTELAGRLRAQEAALFAEEYAAMRRSRQEAEAAAEEKQLAGQLAAAAAEAEARAVREAADAYRMFEAVAKQRSAAYKQRVADDDAAARGAQAQIAAAERLRASIDPTVAAQQRFNSEMAEARTLVSAGVISLDEYAGKLRLERQALAEATEGHGKLAQGATANRMAMQGASYQVQDFMTQVSMGANPINAFAVQGAQLAGQFSEVQGKAGAVARFFMGPWGLAITGGMLVVGMFIDKLREQSNALEDSVDKLKKDAAETEVARQAKERFQHTAEGVAAAIRDGTQATKDAIAAEKSSAEQANSLAGTKLKEQIAIRRTTLALIEQAKVLAENARQQNIFANGPGAAGSTVEAQYAARLSQLEKQAADQLALIEEAQDRLGETRIGLATEAAKRAADPTAKINKLFDDQAAQLRAVARAEGDVSLARANRLANELLTNEIARQAALKAEQDKQRATQQTAQIGRQVDLAEARRIAEGIGARITSERRSYEEQKKLYDKYVAYKSGRGPWAALAAAPGTSDHELGNALDIAKTPGMSLEKIRGAFRAAGVSIKQLLDEGSHFHVSWKKGADSAAEASKKLADAQGELAKRFDPAEAAAMEYRETLKSINEAKLDPATAQQYAAAAGDAFRKARAAAFELPSMAEISASAEDQRAAEKSAEEFQRNVIQPLKDELALYGLVGSARAAAALELEKEAFLLQHKDEGLAIATARWEEYYRARRQLIEKDAGAEREAETVRRMAEDFDRMLDAASRAGDGLAQAFGRGGAAIADAVDAMGEYMHQREELKRQGLSEAQFARESARLQTGLFGDMAGAAKDFFDEKSKGYAALAEAEKAFRAVEFALSVRAMAQDAAETVGAIAKSGARTAAHAVEAVAKAISSLPFPLNLAAGAATAAALASLGISIAGSFGGGSGAFEPSNDGSGTVFGDSAAKSDSIKRSIDALREVDTLTNSYAREMSASLKSIDSQIGGFAALVVRAGDVNASGGVTEGFKSDTTGKLLEGIVTGGGLFSKIPIIGGILGGVGSLLGSLFGSSTKVVGSGLYGNAQSLGSILNGGFDASYYSDIEKTKKFLGIKTGTSRSTQFTAADPALEQQFTLILRSFSDAIKASAGPLGVATSEVEARLNGFVINIGKIDTKGLTGEQIQEKLTAVFGAAADNMANAAFPGLQQFQKVGEGAFETLVRVASTLEAVSGTLDLLGQSATGMSIATKLAIADQFDSVSDLTSAAQAYFEAYYTREEQAAAQAAQMDKVFASLGLTMPGSLAAFRALVEAQDLTTAAGQATYATLLKLAPAFADLQASMEGAKSAAEILSERQDLQRQLLELEGKTAEIRELELAKLDESNRALQRQIWAIQDAQEATRAAEELRKAWGSVGDGIMDEVKRIRGLTGTSGDGSFASLMGQFNAANMAARGGDQEAAKSLPGLSQAMLTAAAQMATSRQELERVQAQTAASLEATYAAIQAMAKNPSAATSTAALLAAAATTAQASTPSAPANDDLIAEIRALRSEVTQLRSESSSGHAAIAGNTGAIKRKLDDVTAQSGGAAIATVAAA